MAIPNYEMIMLPLLQYATDQKEHSLTEATDKLANQFNLTDEEKKKLLPSGQQAIFRNRVGWARLYLKKANLLQSPRRGYFLITEKGLHVLKKNPPKIDVDFLRQFEGFEDFIKPGGEKVRPKQGKVEQLATTPQELLEGAYLNIRNNLVEDLLQQIKESPPNLFEKIVVELLIEMGYGGSRKDAGEAIGKKGDEGIDGIIKEDRLGLDTIYVQAKRWDGTVGRPEVQKFAGALQGQRAKKGIFVTTSDFSKEARDYASSIENKIVLIDGYQLCQFMIDHNIGVSPTASYEVKKIDSDYFTED